MQEKEKKIILGDDGKPLTGRARSLANLNVYTSDQNREEASKNGRKGGKASGEARRERKNIQQLCAELLVQDAPEEFIKKAFPDGTPEDKSWYGLIVAQQARQAAAGNTKAAVFIRDSAGDMPTTKVQADVGMTDADRALLAKIEKRMGKNQLEDDGK